MNTLQAIKNKKREFEIYSTDDDGRLNLNQFCEMIKHNDKAVSNSDVDYLFRVVDKDRKGYITL